MIIFHSFFPLLFLRLYWVLVVAHRSNYKVICRFFLVPTSMLFKGQLYMHDTAIQKAAASRHQNSQCFRLSSSPMPQLQAVRQRSAHLLMGGPVLCSIQVFNCLERHLLLRRKPMTNLDSVLKSRDITLLTKVHMVKAKIFPVVVYRYKVWTIKKAEH